MKMTSNVIHKIFHHFLTTALTCGTLAWSTSAVLSSAAWADEAAPSPMQVSPLLTETAPAQAQPNPEALINASETNNLKEVYALLAAGANPNISRKNGVTPLMAASVLDHIQVVKALLKAGANVNAQDKDGWTAM